MISGPAMLHWWNHWNLTIINIPYPKKNIVHMCWVLDHCRFKSIWYQCQDFGAPITGDTTVLQVVPSLLKIPQSCMKPWYKHWLLITMPDYNKFALVTITIMVWVIKDDNDFWNLAAWVVVWSEYFSFWIGWFVFGEGGLCLEKMQRCNAQLSGWVARVSSSWHHFCVKEK